MNRIERRRRAERLMHAAIRDLALDLREISVLTEAASGAFATTSLLAALAGARRVFAVTRDSPYGSGVEVARYVGDWAAALGLAGRVEVSCEPARRFAGEANLVTNLGFVRPIDAALVARLPADAAVALMVEPWEVRAEDVDLAACRARGVPALGTRETHPRLELFRYVGVVALRLLLEAGIEVFRSRLLVLGSDPFGAETGTVLEAAGATVLLVDPTGAGWNPAALRAELGNYDAVVLAEYRGADPLIGGGRGIPVEWLSAPELPIIQIAGPVDEPAVAAAGLTVVPPGSLGPHRMKVSTAYAGPRPVIDLHAAGLKVGELLVRGLRATGSAERAIEAALANPIAAPPLAGQEVSCG